MDVLILGNGILGLMTAYRLLHADPSVKITIVGPRERQGSASLAAAAMFNSFCEIETSTLKNEFEKQKFLFNKSATEMWPSLIERLMAESGIKQEFGFGTYLINNHTSDTLEDENFDAIVAALEHFKEPYEWLSPRKVPHFKPASEQRASRAILIPREGWINPRQLIFGLDTFLEKSGRVKRIDAKCLSIHASSGRVVSIKTTAGDVAPGDRVLLAPGAAFTKIVKASDLGLQMPQIFYGVGASILLKTGAETLSNCIRTPNRGLACGVYAAPQDAEHTLIGASNFVANEPEEHARITSVYSLLGAAMEQINKDYYRSQLVRVNVGWRPISEDLIPLIGPTSIENLVVASGTRRDGLHCSPLISEYLCELLLKGRSSRKDFDLFKPERKATRIYTRQEAIDTGVRQSINALYQHGFRPSHNRILEDLESHFRKELIALHDKVGAVEWGIPADMTNMYKYGHIPR